MPRSSLDVFRVRAFRDDALEPHLTDLLVHRFALPDDMVGVTQRVVAWQDLAQQFLAFGQR